MTEYELKIRSLKHIEFKNGNLINYYHYELCVIPIEIKNYGFEIGIRELLNFYNELSDYIIDNKNKIKKFDIQILSAELLKNGKVIDELSRKLIFSRPKL